MTQLAARLDRTTTAVIATVLALIATAVAIGWSTGPVQSAGPSLVAITPARLVDTRPGERTVDGNQAGSGRLGEARILTVDVAGRGGVATDATAAVLNITVVDPFGGGYATVFPCGDEPTTSTVNYDPRTVTASAAFVELASGQACIKALGDPHIVVDVQGVTTNSSELAPARLERLLDSRSDGETVDGRFAREGIVDAGETRGVAMLGRAGLPAQATTAVIVLTAVSPVGDGHLIAYECGTGRPPGSVLNYRKGRDTATSVLVDIGSGSLCIYTSMKTHIVVDVSGYATGDSQLQAHPSHRLADTRSDGATSDSALQATGILRAETTLEVPVAGRVGVSADSRGAMLKVISVSSQGPGYLTIYNCDTERPLASNINFQPGQTLSNLVFAPLSADGSVCVYTSSTTHVVVDLEGTVGAGRSAAPASSTTATATSATAPITTAPTATAPTTTATTSTSTPSTTTPTTTPSTTTPTTTPSTTTPTTTPSTTTTTVPADVSGFVHPGVLVSGDQLAEVGSRVAGGEEPWAGASADLGGSRYGHLSYSPRPVAVIRAASGGNSSYIASRGWSNVGDVSHLDDARAAYTHALLWSQTGDQAYADKAMEIMDAWSSTLTEIKFDQPRRSDNNSQVWNNGKLQAGWGGSLFARAGEIVRYTGAGWSDGDVARFEDMLTEVYLPLTISGWSNGANWLMSLTEATMSIGVFTNDRAAFDAGVQMWRELAPTTIYHPSDGAYPRPPVAYYDTPSRMNALWFAPTSYVPGLQAEALRDLSHMTMGLGAMSNGASTAAIQGVDLFGEQSDRIVSGYETSARYVNDYLDEIDRRGGEPSSSWRPDGWPGSNFRTGGTAYRSGWEVAHHHYVGRGVSMPETTRLVGRLRGLGGNQAALHLSWETVTHGT